MSKVLLNLDTLVVRPRIAIDGHSHEILSPDELPVLKTHLLASKGRRMDELMKSAELDDAGKVELRSVVADISDAIMEPVPREVRDKLSEAQRISVIEAFTALLLTKKLGTAAALIQGLAPAGMSPAEQKPPTGAKSSRASSGSTAGRQGGGSRKPQSPS